MADWPGTAVCLETIAWLHASGGECTRAAKVFGAVKTMLHNMGAPLPVVMRKDHDAWVEHARGELGDTTYEKAVASGACLTPDDSIAFALDEEPTSTPPQETADVYADVTLTRREQEIAGLIAEGLSNREIAAHLVIAQRTAEGHVDHILHKLGFTSRAQVAVWVVEWRAHHGHSSPRSPN
jgi:DNA-binding CsgD family transcriptional regulator